MLKILGRVINRYLSNANKDCDNPDKSPLLFFISFKKTLWDGIYENNYEFLEFLEEKCPRLNLLMTKSLYK